MPPNVTEVAPVKFVPVTVTVVPAVPAVGASDAIVGSAGVGGGGGAGDDATIHGAGAVVSPARNSNVPCRAGVPPSQCCTNVTPNDFSRPLGAKSAHVTLNDPVSVLQPRPLPDTSSPGPVPLN